MTEHPDFKARVDILLAEFTPIFADIRAKAKNKPSDGFYSDSD
jgi:hypothetical protein